MDEEDRERLIQFQIEMYKLVIPIFLGIAALAVFANGIVIIALRNTRVYNATVTLILSLTISDIWTSSVVAFSLLYNSYLPKVYDTRVNLCFSLILEIMRTGGLITGALHLLLISFHHYIGILNPYSDKRFLTHMAQFLSGIAWSAPLLALVTLALSFPDQGFWNCENVHFYHSRAFRLSISLLLIIIFILITSTYIRLLRILRIQRQKWRNQQLKNMTTSLLNTGNEPPMNTIFESQVPLKNGYPNGNVSVENEVHKGSSIHIRRGSPSGSEFARNSGANRLRKMQRENRTLWTTILICSSFFFGWAPATIHFTITCDTCELLKAQRFRTIFLLSCLQLCFILGKSLLNPLIYSLRIPEVDQQIRKFFIIRLTKHLFKKYILCQNNETTNGYFNATMDKTRTSRVFASRHTHREGVLDSISESPIDEPKVNLKLKSST